MASRGVLLIIAIFSLLILQAGSAIVFAEQVGLSCHLDADACGSEESNGNSEGDSKLPDSKLPSGSEKHDSKCSCTAVVLMCEVPCLVLVPAYVSEFVPVMDDDARDSLSRAIDYPPQLG